VGGVSRVSWAKEIAQRREYSEMTAREVDEEIKAILKESYERALSTLRGHRSELDRVVNALLEREEIPGEEVLELVGVRQ
jgi:cell division protease FtsH